MKLVVQAVVKEIAQPTPVVNLESSGAAVAVAERVEPSSSKKKKKSKDEEKSS